MGDGGGPPNKWAWFNAAGLKGDQIGQKLNDLAKQGFNDNPIEIEATDGRFVYVGGYEE